MIFGNPAKARRQLVLHVKTRIGRQDGSLGLPRAYEEEGAQRYGFHGLSYEFIARQLRVIDPDLANSRVIVAHLGNGASLCAMHDGRSVDTTMSFMAASLGGLDGLVFTAGIGEHASEIRSRICARCSWLGVVLDESANRAGRMRITPEASRTRVYVIPTDEEKMIARYTVSHIC